MCWYAVYDLVLLLVCVCLCVRTAPVPMADIERMAALCMKDLDDEDMGYDDLEDDEDLLVTHSNCKQQEVDSLHL